MSKNKKTDSMIFKRFSLAALPLAIALAQLPSSAQAATSWVSTATSAFLLPGAQRTAGVRPDTSVAAPTGYALNVSGMPALTDTKVTPLEVSQPLHIVVVLKGRDEAGLDALLREQSEPGSANYQRYLTTAEFNERFAPTQAQVKAVVAHLRANGFGNISVSENNKLISAEGNVENARGAFNVTLKRFNYRGKSVYGNDAPAQVPGELGGAVQAVLGLQNAEVPHRLIHRLLPPSALIGEQDHAAQMLSGQQVGHKPTDFAQIYGASGLPPATKTTVGIVTWGDMTQTIADLKQFTQSAGLPTVNTAVVPGGQGTLADDGDPAEWDLDSQDIVGVSGGVKKLVFYAAINGDSSDSGLTDATLTQTYNTVATRNEAKLINVSLGEDEAAAYADGSLKANDAAFKQAAAQGQIFSIASGDAGVYQWSYSPQGAPGFIGNYNGSGTAITTTIPMTKYSVSWPASSPYVVAVGGTTLATTNRTTWAGETVWNEGAAYADLDFFGNPADNAARIWATGGGVSSYEAVPAWQTAVLGSAVKKRALPDVAFDAASSTGALIVIGGQADQQVGGTSLSSPIFVGGFARIESAHNNVIGLPTSCLYRKLSSNKALVRDVTASSNNGYGQYGYKPATGWDHDTGFGSLQFSKLSATY
ncbi:peptidase S53 [Trinickia dabaoshanensis]|uniref:Peptidase S53 n=1 Tax=Trinickia dabaoshanensis TaxID=564714 RepID=A0A2N7VGC4_9BURK|nr:S53 family peptidase [Trinickia dabaoshanensis]PMS16201.1 peptidase S53 [Trinickia dabaoshanensis]